MDAPRISQLICNLLQKSRKPSSWANLPLVHERHLPELQVLNFSDIYDDPHNTTPEGSNFKNDAPIEYAVFIAIDITGQRFLIDASGQGIAGPAAKYPACYHYARYVLKIM